MQIISGTNQEFWGQEKYSYKKQKLLFLQMKNENHQIITVAMDLPKSLYFKFLKISGTYNSAILILSAVVKNRRY